MYQDVNFNMDSTNVKESDIPALVPTYVNAPEDLDSAVQRILKAEMLMEDMARAAEIAQITGQWNILESFVSQANEYLAGKIQIEQPDHGPMKIRVVTGTLKDQESSDATAG